MHIDIRIRVKSVKAMIGTGATHNFITNNKAKWLGLIVKKDQRKLKAVNSKALAISRIAKLARCKMGPYNMNVSFTVALLNDFDIVLGLEFLM